MGRGLDGCLLLYLSRPCAVFKLHRGGLAKFRWCIAKGRHLFPFRTEQLSLSAPMVLGGQPPGRVGRRRFFLQRPGRNGARAATPVSAAPGGAADRRALCCSATAVGEEDV